MKRVLLSHVFGSAVVEAFFPDRFADGSTPKNVQRLLKLGRLEPVEKDDAGRRVLVGFRRRGSRRREDHYPLAIGIPLTTQKPRSEDSGTATPRRRMIRRKGTGMKYKLKDGAELGGEMGVSPPEFEKMEDGSFESVVTNETGTSVTINIAPDSEDAAKLEEIPLDPVAEAAAAAADAPESGHDSQAHDSHDSHPDDSQASGNADDSQARDSQGSAADDSHDSQAPGKADDSHPYARAAGTEGPYTVSEHIANGHHPRTYDEAVAALKAEPGSTPEETEAAIRETDARTE